MIDERDLVERAIRTLATDEPNIERLRRRRDRKHRNQRIAAGVMAAVVVATVVGAAIFGYMRSPKPLGRGLGPAFRHHGEVLEHGHDGRLEVVDPSTGEFRVLIDSRVGDAAWSPDGTRLAYTIPCAAGKDDPDPCARGASRSAGLWLKTAVDDPVQLVSWYRATGRPGVTFAWSPDATRIAYARSGIDAGLYVANADGTQQTLVTATADDPGELMPPSWSPDGRNIAYSRYHHVSIVPLDGGAATEVTEAG